jgi:predicted Zn-dependent peptidase
MKILSTLCAFLLIASLTAAQKQIPLPKDLPPYAPEKPFAAPNVKATTLDNGLTVWLVSEPGFPQIALDLAVRGGYAADPAERPGISELLANTLAEGTASRSAKQIAQEVQAAGGDLSAAPHADSLEVSLTVLTDKIEPGLAVFSDVVENASFPDAEVALARRNAAQQLQQQEADASFLASRATAQVLFGSHPYHVISPTQASIDASTAAGLRDLFAQRFRPDQAILIAVGDFHNDPMLELIRSKFGQWKSPSVPSVPPTPAPASEVKHAIFIVPRPGSVQTTLELATFGPLRSDPDYPAAVVANAIYGGMFGSRLTLNIREDKGYTYSPYAFVRSYRAAGYIASRADVRNAVTAPTLNEVIYELNRMVTTSPTDDELATARRYLVGIQAIELQARASIAAQLAGIWVDGLPPDELSIYGKKIAATTGADLDAAALKYFPAARSAIVAVGEEKVIRDALAPFGIPMETLK